MAGEDAAWNMTWRKCLGLGVGTSRYRDTQRRQTGRGWKETSGTDSLGGVGDALGAGGGADSGESGGGADWRAGLDSQRALSWGNARGLGRDAISLHFIRKGQPRVLQARYHNVAVGERRIVGSTAMESRRRDNAQ